MQFQKLVHFLLLLVGILVLIPACKRDDVTQITPTNGSSISADNYSHEVATLWSNQFYSLTKVCPGFTPPVAARAFGYAGLAMYEAVVPGITNGKSLSGQLTGFSTLPTIEPNTEYNWPIAANAAAAYMARNLYANMPIGQQEVVATLESNTLKELQNGIHHSIVTRSILFGQSIAKAVFEYSKTDGGHEGYAKNFPANYTAPTGLGLWEPTAPLFQKALQPYWGNNRTFVPGVVAASQPVHPQTYSTDPSSAFYIQAKETHDVVAAAIPENIKTAKFWSDDPGLPGTPPGHSVSLAIQLVKKENLKLDEAITLLCKVGIAVSDAFVSCWKCKFDFNLVRPITYIREHISPDWTPVLTTPPFPEYTSGHSVQVGATIKVLIEQFGDNYTFTDETHKLRTDIDGTPRTYNSFSAMAEEAAFSRLYGGIHYRDAIELGVLQGGKVGTAVNGLQFK